MATTGQKVTGGVTGMLLLAAISVGPVTHYFEPAPLKASISVAYYDQYGKVWTICDGHTKGVKQGETATPDQCASFSLDDRLDAAQTVNRCLPTLTGDRLGALTDAVFNLGPAVACGSKLQHFEQQREYYAMCMQLTDATGKDGWPDGWTKAGGQRLKGLVLRRIYDRDWCLSHRHKGFP